ncbi:thioesterase superfamily protein [Xylariaceae sp. FL1019]|nr:thioesterase superfamily protein [Xylariaceae sp. FL1019]
MADEDRAHFAAIPWCARHLDQPHVIACQPTSRTAKPTLEDALFAVTLKTDGTIKAMLQFFDRPATPQERVEEIKVFLTLGCGLNGYPGVCHGGLVTTILDEVVGLLIPINMEREMILRGTYMTAYLNTTFVKPVATSSTVLARASFTKVEGRKYFAIGSIEDENGVLLAKADALFVQLKSAL